MIVIAALAIPLFGFAIMSLWNWLMPSLFSLREVTFWQALGVFFLSRILFGGFGTRHRGHRWERMTDEERERFRRGFGVVES